MYMPLFYWRISHVYSTVFGSIARGQRHHFSVTGIRDYSCALRATVCGARQTRGTHSRYSQCRISKGRNVSCTAVVFFQRAMLAILWFEEKKNQTFSSVWCSIYCSIPVPIFRSFVLRFRSWRCHRRRGLHYLAIVSNIVSKYMIVFWYDSILSYFIIIYGFW